MPATDGGRVSGVSEIYGGGAMMVDENVSLIPACKGMNCGCTDGFSHSPECIAEHEECTRMPYIEKHLHHPDTGTGWKCYVCGYGGAANHFANTFCVNCHCHR